MSLSCPQCNANLPEDVGLEYRFCPECGAQISVMTTDVHANIQTIPPDLNVDAQSSTGEKTAANENEESRNLVNQTQAPEVFHHRKGVRLRDCRGPRLRSRLRLCLRRCLRLLLARDNDLSGTVEVGRGHVTGFNRLADCRELIPVQPQYCGHLPLALRNGLLHELPAKLRDL